MVAEPHIPPKKSPIRCSLAKISMVAELATMTMELGAGCSLAKISMVAERIILKSISVMRCSLAKISMVAERKQIIFS